MDLQTLPDGSTVAASYDASSNLTSLTPPGKPAHVFDYTAIDQQQTYTPPHVAGDGTRSTSYAYNVDRQLTSVARPDAKTVTPSYDAATGRITSLAWSAGQETFAYDAAGRLAALAAPGGITNSFGYDGPLPTSETWSGTISGSVTRTFDNDFRLSSESVNGGSTASFAYDRDGLLTAVVTVDATETISRDAQTGQIAGTAVGAVATTRRYNAFGEPAEDAAFVNGAPLYDAVYDDGATNPRDALGRIQHLSETIAGVTRAYDYAYDLRGRLTGVQIDGVITRSYTYDANGNRLTKTEGAATTFYVYDEQDRLLCERSSAGADCASGVTVSYGWTANGELASKTDATGTTSYAYDELGNLRHVDLPGGHAIEYLVDGANRRVGRVLDGVLTNAWVYRNSLKPVAELDGGGNVVARFVYDSKGQVPDLIERGGAAYRVVSDHLGSPRLVVDQGTGAIVERIDFDEWGNVASDTNPGWMPFGFDGGLADVATGLVRFGARDYDARSGSWTAKDPIGLGGGRNLYAFVELDPVNQTDLTGRGGFGWFGEFEGEAGIGVVGVGANVTVGGGTVWGPTGNGQNFNFISGGAFGGAPIGTISGTPGWGAAIGTYVGGGPGAFITSADAPCDFAGPGRYWAVNFGSFTIPTGLPDFPVLTIPGGSLGLTVGDNGVWTLGLAFGPSGGWSVASFRTTTKLYP